MIIQRKKIISLTSLVLCFFIVISIVPINVQAAGPNTKYCVNLLSSPGAEVPSAAWGTWVLNPSQSTLNFGTPINNKQLVRTGSKSIFIDTSSGGYGQYHQDVTGLTIGNKYIASVWVNTSKVTSGDSWSVSIACGNSTATINNRNTNGWEQLKVEFTAQLSDVRLILLAGGTDVAVSFDDAVLVQTFSDQEISWLAQLIFWEVKGHNSYCLELAGQVAINRVNAGGYYQNYNTLQAVINQPSQYASANYVFNGKWTESTYSTPTYTTYKNQAIAAARKLACGESVDENGNAWPSNVYYQHSFSSSTALGPLFKTYTAPDGSKEHFNFG